MNVIMFTHYKMALSLAILYYLTNSCLPKPFMCRSNKHIPLHVPWAIAYEPGSSKNRMILFWFIQCRPYTICRYPAQKYKYSSHGCAKFGKLHEVSLTSPCLWNYVDFHFLLDWMHYMCSAFLFKCVLLAVFFRYASFFHYLFIFLQGWFSEKARPVNFYMLEVR